MANEIKFVFVGDTADFDKAIDSIVKKTNKIKDVDKDANKVRKQAVNLEKVLADEYEKARKNAGSLTDITKKLAREEAKRLDINKKLSSETLSQACSRNNCCGAGSRNNSSRKGNPLRNKRCRSNKRGGFRGREND